MKSRGLLHLLTVWFAASLLANAGEPLKLVHTIPLQGIKGRFDHFAYDASTHRLIVAALGNDTAEIFDVAKFKWLHTIAGLHKPTGALLLSEPNRVYLSNGDDGTIRAFDADNYKPVSQLGSLDDADNIRFDPTSKLIYVSYGDGALGVTDAATTRLLHSIPLPAHPESFQLEAHGPRIFVNLPFARQIAVIDREKEITVAKWPMGLWLANFPMALDEAGHRLFVGCRMPARLVVFDTERGKPVADLEISGDTDDLFFDAKRQRIYVSCGEGYLDVIQRHEGDRYERIAHITTRAGARTCFFSPELDLLFLAVPEHDGHDAELRVYQPE